MKKILLVIIVFISVQLVNAQDYYRSYDHHGIQIGYGAFIPDQFNNFETSMLDELYPQQREVRDRFSSIGTFFLTYRHVFKNENMLWGVTAGYSSSSSEIYNIGQYEGVLDRQFISFAIEWDYRYVNRNGIQLYSGFGLGYTYGTEKLTPPEESVNPVSTGDISSVAYQLNAVGIRLGKKYAFFLELGYGYKGIFNTGFSVQLF